ncbi:response regulator [Asticcacaulis benevestitus]|uniref:response regulator n=1 Tax=Asticcacaulis benevestitus TaxID=347481 RepID=UPI001FD06FA8|nr:response regulator [Asticcacaulis benevestitus]
MSKLDYTVTCANSGPRAMEIARQQRPDIIILDIYMPGQSGYEVLAEIRADDDLCSTPVILASSDDNRLLGLEAGASEVLVKPLQRDHLRRILEVFSATVESDILLVDDDPVAGDIVQRFAARAGLRVQQALDATEALSLARARRPKAIILDLCMPGTDGFEMMETLSKDAALKLVPIMVLSARDLNPQEYLKIREAGHVYCAKGRSSPREIIQNLKAMVSQ